MMDNKQIKRCFYENLPCDHDPGNTGSFLFAYVIIVSEYVPVT